jgi:hypothetical protein
MYVDPFWMGVFSTIVVEVILIVGWAVLSSKSNKK